MNRLRFAGAVLGVWLLMPGLAGAQEATPDIQASVAAPEDCSVAPRSVEELEALLDSAGGSPSPAVALETPNTEAATPTPFVAPAGSPVSEDVGAEIAELVNQLYACENANDQLRLFALLTDGLVVRTLQEGQLEPADFVQSGTPIAPKIASEYRAIAINGIIEIEPDTYGVNVVGRAGDEGEEFTEYLIVVREGDSLRIDAIEKLSE
jgi:hypothetical protein